MSTSLTAPSVSQPVDAALRRDVRRTTRVQRLRAFALVVPLLVFILIFFIVPIIDMMTRSLYDPRTARLLPETAAALEHWNFEGLPDEAVYAAVAEELLARDADGSVGRLALHLNYEISGARSLIFDTARALRGRSEPTGSYKEALIAIDEAWGEREIWSGLKILSQPFTIRHYLTAFDHQYDVDGDIVPRPDYQRVYMSLLWRTLWASATIVGLCLLAGYPIAHHIATSPARTGNLLLILVLLPFWTALLVRTAAWIVLLQQQGVINDVLVATGLISDDNRLRLVYNMTGTIIAMTHIMLPFMVLPLYSVMKGISPAHMRAAQSLGATPLRAFLRVYLPQTMPGVGAGSILVFILSIGFYITPALVGGRTGRFISSFVAYHIQQSLNWGLAAALAGVILVSVLALYVLYERLFGKTGIRLG